MRKGIRLAAIAAVLLAATTANKANNDLKSLESELHHLPRVESLHVFDRIRPKLEKARDEALNYKQGLIFADFSGDNPRRETYGEITYPDTIAARKLIKEALEILERSGENRQTLHGELKWIYDQLPDVKIDATNFEKFGSGRAFGYLRGRLEDVMAATGVVDYRVNESDRKREMIKREQEIIQRVDVIRKDYASTMEYFYASMAATLGAALGGAASVLSRPYTQIRKR